MTIHQDPFSHDKYLFRKKVFRVFGGAFHIYDPSGGLLLYSDQARFKLREDIRTYSDESKTDELLTIKARQVIDISATYDVVDARTGASIGSLRRKGLKSMLRDEWALLDPQGQEMGLVQEDSTLKALLRRFLSNLLPQSYTVSIGGQPVATFRQHFNPFVLRYTLDLSGDSEKKLDQRLAIAAGILLCAIERRQRRGLSVAP